MLFTEIILVYPDIHKKPINHFVCKPQNYLLLKYAVHIVTKGFIGLNKTAQFINLQFTYHLFPTKVKYHQQNEGIYILHFQIYESKSIILECNDNIIVHPSLPTTCEDSTEGVWITDNHEQWSCSEIQPWAMPGAS
jgi:hypothetical protein